MHLSKFLVENRRNLVVIKHSIRKKKKTWKQTRAKSRPLKIEKANAAVREIKLSRTRAPNSNNFQLHKFEYNLATNNAVLCFLLVSPIAEYNTRAEKMVIQSKHTLSGFRFGACARLQQYVIHSFSKYFLRLPYTFRGVSRPSDIARPL